ncbi:FadR/GntR family transcriptional regulator [Actinoplanes siamensis]|uniref:GntR C-terminal domain-containing protein n=1 Tax=Actinoplanes siamensis TaxID=1223317 RepID=A0A919TK90_9ACTN|nr:FCD domain-containing protein [Actinoplanes siamensis]GIF04960.1 hypothetical protein Asi03nite_24980 [Actinoplanes siamensis]
MNGPLRRLRDALENLYLDAGAPSTRKLSSMSGGAISHTSVGQVLRCDHLPTWRTMWLVVRLLGGGDDLEHFKELWNSAKNASEFEPAAPGESVSDGADDWNVFDIGSVRRRLALKPHPLMRLLTDVRSAIEPVAAFLAAEHLTEADADKLSGLARQLQQLGRDELFRADDESGADWRERYRAVDVEFHVTILRGCRNDFFSGCTGHVTEALDYRIRHDRLGTGGNKPFPDAPTSIALWLHRGLAAAIQQRRCSAAEAFSRAILAEIREGPLPESVAQALRGAYQCLDPALFGPGRADWSSFEAEIVHLLDSEVWPGR